MFHSAKDRLVVTRLNTQNGTFKYVSVGVTTLALSDVVEARLNKQEVGPVATVEVFLRFLSRLLDFLKVVCHIKVRNKAFAVGPRLKHDVVKVST